jgi:predicted MFS family arabinose efflux permease
MLGFLTLALLVSHLDRHVLAIALDQIKVEFALSDTQLGVLAGLPFAVVFVLFGFLSARFSRPGRYKPFVVVALLVWSGATMALGLAGGFLTLLLCRVVVGGGEATAIPPSHAMIAQAYPPERRASALAVFQAGASLGLFCAFVIGGLVIAEFGWRMVFIGFGVLGIALALPLTLGLHEVTDPTHPAGATPEKRSIVQVALIILRDPAPRRVLMGLILATVVAYGGIAWIPTYLRRVHEMPLPQVGLYLALTAGLLAALGTWLGGVVSDRAERRRPGGRLRFVALTLVLAKIGSVSFYLLGGSWVALVVFLVPVFLNTIYVAPAMAFIFAHVEPQDRPVASAFLMFCSHLFGLSLGPLIVGIVSDAAQGSVASPLGLGLLALQSLGFWAAWCFWRAAPASVPAPAQVGR